MKETKHIYKNLSNLFTKNYTFFERCFVLFIFFIFLASSPVYSKDNKTEITILNETPVTGLEYIYIDGGLAEDSLFTPTIDSENTATIKQEAFQSNKIQNPQAIIYVSNTVEFLNLDKLGVQVVILNTKKNVNQNIKKLVLETNNNIKKKNKPKQLKNITTKLNPFGSYPIDDKNTHITAANTISSSTTCSKTQSKVIFLDLVSKKITFFNKFKNNLFNCFDQHIFISSLVIKHTNRPPPFQKLI